MYLYITRKKNQTILIGDDVEIIYVPNQAGFGDDVITLGISAPKEVRILRGELKNGKGKAPTRPTKG